VENFAGAGESMVSGAMYPLWRGGGASLLLLEGGRVGVVAEYFEYYGWCGGG